MLTRLTFRQLEYCVAASEFGSISLAAESISVSPSSISAAITQVESELQVALFVRLHGQGLSLTPVGEEVIRQVRVVMESASALYEVADQAQRGMRGTLRVGCFSTLAAMVTPELCQAFARAHPTVEVSLVEDDHEGLMHRLRMAQIDVAITYDLSAEPDIVFEPLAPLPPYALVSETDPLAQQPSTSLDELSQLPMILLDMPLSREYFVSLFRSAGLMPRIAARSASGDVVRSLVANGFGYSLFNARPRANLSLDGKRLVEVPLTGKHRPMMLGLAWAAQQKRRRVVEAFMERCRTFVSKDYIPGMRPGAVRSPPGGELPGTARSCAGSG
ncbi:MAG TPA: LysR family transcriptional regulator [Ramlibacter sp.]|uniref:LysR family transcriptional regulator n=1 Tax=Ramlibacter sp. TaxID=1917967 RepID=UPI002BC6A9A6|nr:LysR family transcriptional regulator [Ramlibacter sp.]HVZ44115.1 LysR family transcriptional regulator [Ramlibacter sp.]